MATTNTPITTFNGLEQPYFGAEKGEGGNHRNEAVTRNGDGLSTESEFVANNRQVLDGGLLLYWTDCRFGAVCRLHAILTQNKVRLLEA